MDILIVCLWVFICSAGCSFVLYYKLKPITSQTTTITNNSPDIRTFSRTDEDEWRICQENKIKKEE